MKLELALEELRKSLSYHKRQIEDNLREIERREQSIAMYEEKNIKHAQMVEELNQVIEKIED